MLIISGRGGGRARKNPKNANAQSTLTKFFKKDNSKMKIKYEVVVDRNELLMTFFVKHTGENLKRIILNELEKFNISPASTFSITSDNGSNMIKATKLTEIKSNKNQSVPTSN